MNVTLVGGPCAKLLVDILHESRATVTSVEIVEDAAQIVRYADCDAVVLCETKLPDAHDHIRILRKGSKIPIIVALMAPVVGRDATYLVTSLLDKGADDCIFDGALLELPARLRAIVRRVSGHASNALRAGPITVNLKSQQASVDGKSVHLTRLQYQVLELLVRRSGSVVTRDSLLSHLYGGLDEPNTKILDVCICKLRKIISEASKDGCPAIKTVWGRGWMVDGRAWRIGAVA